MGMPAAGGTIVQYWHSENPPPYIVERVTGFRECDREMAHRLFSEATAAELIAERFGDRHAEAFAACAIPAMQADYFRYCAVHALGGVYVDADYRFKRSLRGLLDSEGRIFERPPSGPVLNGLFAFRSPGHPFLAMAIEVATFNIENRICDSVPLMTGPAIFTALLHLLRGGRLESLRESAGPRVRPHLETCWDPLCESFTRAVAKHSAGAEPLAGVRVCSRTEMLTWVQRPETELPYKHGDDYWGNWQGTIFRPTASEGQP